MTKLLFEIAFTQLDLILKKKIKKKASHNLMEYVKTQLKLHGSLHCIPCTFVKCDLNYKASLKSLHKYYCKVKTGSAPKQLTQ